jgi:hypothetical protein
MNHAVRSFISDTRRLQQAVAVLAALLVITAASLSWLVVMHGEDQEKIDSAWAIIGCDDIKESLDGIALDLRSEIDYVAEEKVLAAEKAAVATVSNGPGQLPSPVIAPELDPVAPVAAPGLSPESIPNQTPAPAWMRWQVSLDHPALLGATTDSLTIRSFLVTVAKAKDVCGARLMRPVDVDDYRGLKLEEITDQKMSDFESTVKKVQSF